MTTLTLPTGPDPEAITATILARYPGTDVVRAMAAIFFSLDPEKQWPNFATIVTTDEHDEGAPSNLTARDGVFRLNIGVSRATFQRAIDSTVEPDYAAFDRVLPHPVYARQLWISILNPGERTFRDTVLPLLDEAHGRVSRSRATHREVAS